MTVINCAFKRHYRLVALFACAVGGFFSNVWAITPTTEALPTWELGIGGGALNIPDYRGSNRDQVLLVPIPYIVYRSELFKADRDGIRGELAALPRIELNISISGSLAYAADDNPLRVGMPELDPTFELGPSLNIDLSPKQDKQIQLKLPLRAVYSFGAEGIGTVGTVFHPHLAYRESLRNDWRFKASVGPYYASDNYHDYYYTVAPQYALADRPSYEADVGYSGWSANVSLSRRIKKFWYGGFVRYDNLADATFKESPLVETNHYWVYGIAGSWIFGQSKSTVGNDDSP
ncbi:MAG: MipA/OmpV family protein [Gammaproteobacteria bacterium]|nr:MipA/OmpV family protein [Gammaproteobacteria bacterium]